MIYEFTKQPDGVVLERVDTSTARLPDILMAITGVVATILGALEIRDFGPDNVESSVPFYMIIGGPIAVLIFSIRAILKGRTLSVYPDKVFFNNQSRVVEIMQVRSNAKRIAISYSEISNIAPRVHVRYSGSGTSRRSSDWYSVAIYLKDGSAWDLIEDIYANDSSAESWLNRWIDGVHYEGATPVSVTLPTVDTTRLSIVNFGEELRIKWENHFPDNLVVSIVQPLILIGFVCFMAISLINAEGPDLETLVMRLQNVASISEVPAALGGFMFVLPPLLAGIIWLAYVVVSTFRFRYRMNNLTMTKTQITTPSVALSNDDVGAVGIIYSMKNEQPYIRFTREPVEHYKKTIVSERVETVDLTSEHGKKIMKSFDEGMSAGALFKNWITSIPQQIKEAKKLSMEFENNILGTVSFDNFSPLDVYVVKESIRQRLSKATVR